MGERSAVVDGLRAYWLIAGMWVRSGMTYRTSFVVTLIGNLMMTGMDFVGILLMFSQVDTLGGWSLPEVAFLYGLSVTAFGNAVLALGSMDDLGARMRDGSFDTLLVRPAPVPTASRCAASAGSPRARWCWAGRWCRSTSTGPPRRCCCCR